MILFLHEILPLLTWTECRLPFFKYMLPRFKASNLHNKEHSPQKLVVTFKSGHDGDTSGLLIFLFVDFQSR